MLQNLQPTAHTPTTGIHSFGIHDSLRHCVSGQAAQRIAAGTMVVRRESNPRRRFAVTFRHLGKLNPIGVEHLQDLIACFSALATEVSNHQSPVVIGLAESGIVPSFAMHQACLQQGRSARWFCTSRINRGGPGFREPHSHAPDHFLPSALFEQPVEELWVVEDEITTGQTLVNLLSCLNEAGTIRRIRIFSLLDTRQSACSTHQVGLPMLNVASILRSLPNFWNEENRPAVSVALSNEPTQFIVGESMVDALPALLSGTLRSLQHITLSPWKPDGHHILTRQEPLPGYYLYNAQESLDG